jgi:hypothetical protein
MTEGLTFHRMSLRPIYLLHNGHVHLTPQVKPSTSKHKCLSLNLQPAHPVCPVAPHTRTLSATLASFLSHLPCLDTPQGLSSLHPKSPKIHLLSIFTASTWAEPHLTLAQPPPKASSLSSALLLPSSIPQSVHRSQSKSSSWPCFQPSNDFLSSQEKLKTP